MSRFARNWCVYVLLALYSSVNSDLNLRIDQGGLKASPITVEGFAYMWAGARSNYGVKKGKVAFEVKVSNIHF